MSEKKTVHENAQVEDQDLDNVAGGAAVDYFLVAKKGEGPSADFSPDKQTPVGHRRPDQR